uniref:Uncharacterized protein n=1 Tax=Rhizophora mucronata TaxID=61149 RepID=A0A2P2P5H9_RHIMU
MLSIRPHRKALRIDRHVRKFSTSNNNKLWQIVKAQQKNKTFNPHNHDQLPQIEDILHETLACGKSATKKQNI